MSDQIMNVHYLSQVHQISNLIFIIVPIFTVVLQDEVLAKTNTAQRLNKIFSGQLNHVTFFIKGRPQSRLEQSVTSFLTAQDSNCAK